MTRNVEAIRSLFRVSHNRSAPDEPLTGIFPGHSPPNVSRLGILPPASDVAA